MNPYTQHLTLFCAAFTATTLLIELITNGGKFCA